LAAAALQRGKLVGGTLTSAMGAAGRPLAVPAAEGGPPVGWLYDPESGYYADVVRGAGGQCSACALSDSARACFRRLGSTMTRAASCTLTAT
jgi:hypothetical protein